jgi:hypothetical protein
VDRADAGTGEHRHHDLRNHRHIDGYAVAFLHPARLQYVGELANLLVKLAVGDLFVVLGIIALPDDGNLIAPAIEVTVQAVVADIELGTLKPLDLGVVEIELTDLVPFLAPAYELFGLLAPEAVWIIDRALVRLLVRLFVDVSALRELRFDIVDF